MVNKTKFYSSTKGRQYKYSRIKKKKVSTKGIDQGVWYPNRTKTDK